MEMAALDEIGSTVASLVEQSGPAVVGLGRGWGVGSGVVIESGLVLTNAHNLRSGADEVTITFADGRREDGRVAAVDEDLDIAVIAVETGEVEPVQWSEDGDGPAMGRPVVAMGNPGGRGLRATVGFVSSASRSFRGPRGRRIPGAIEHSAPLPRGSSGGPLLDTAGRLLGINSVRVDGGLILALPADRAMRDRAQALARGEAPKRARLGVAIAPPRAARRLRRAVGLPPRAGVLVREVEDGSPAARAGIERGDLIAAADGREIERVDVLYEALDAAASAQQLELTVVRGSDERSVPVSL
jgi:S1-C subfamily serine protease